MSEKTDTVMISTENGPVLINKSDFDPKEHKVHKEDKDDHPRGELNQFLAPIEPPPAASAPVMGEQHPAGNTPESAPGPEGDGERRVMLSEPVPPASAGQSVNRTVAKIGRKYFVVDAATGEKVEGEGIEEGGYKEAADAWKVVNPALSGGDA